jgi:hypothetical protein
LTTVDKISLIVKCSDGTAAVFPNGVPPSHVPEVLINTTQRRLVFVVR